MNATRSCPIWSHDSTCHCNRDGVVVNTVWVANQARKAAKVQTAVPAASQKDLAGWTSEDFAESRRRTEEADNERRAADDRAYAAQKDGWE
jgi:hypothetical protein